MNLLRNLLNNYMSIGLYLLLLNIKDHMLVSTNTSINAFAFFVVVFFHRTQLTQKNLKFVLVNDIF